MRVNNVDRILVVQAVLVLVLVGSIVIQNRVDGGAQTAMLILGGASCVGLVATLAMRRTSILPSQNARRSAYNRAQPPPATPVQPPPQAVASTTTRRRRTRKR